MKLIKEVRDFNLKHIFECGQCFRWEEEPDGSYTGTALGRTINLNMEKRQDADAGTENARLIIDGTDENEFQDLWRRYFDFDRDYGEIKRTLSMRDSVIGSAIAAGSGIRLLNQDNWETLISFIISQNSNIPRIKKCIEKLSENFGEELPTYRGKKRYAFPSIEALSELSPQALSEIGLGYRARYITETAKTIARDGGKMLYSLGELPVREAYEYLVSLCGVGPKVANCILLFSMQKYESFPIDVWVKRVMNRLYHIDENDSAKMESFAVETFGEYGGFAQQYLFYYMREFPKEQRKQED